MVIETKLDTQQVILGTLIALLRRQFPAINIQEQLSLGIREAKLLLVSADIAKLAGQNLIIDELEGRVAINAQNIGVYLQPEWAAKTGEDKVFNVIASDRAWGYGGETTYVVPTGKTLYITEVASISAAASIGDNEKHQFMELRLGEAGGAEPYSYLGGNGGCSQSFPKPLVYEAGETFTLGVKNNVGHNSSMIGTAQGYEV